MRDVVVVGGGLSGLVAAYQLAQHDLDVTLIEVKRRLGGSIQSVQHEGIIMDAGVFAIADTLDSDWLAQLGLGDALFRLDDETVAFKQGTQTLIDALAEKITATRLMRMAVSSIGELENSDKFAICMENGLLFDARAIILAVPAQYAERMFYGYITPITEMLLDYHYDSIQRVSLVCKTDDLPEDINPPADMAFPYVHRTTHPERVPDGYTLLQCGIRINPQRYDTQDKLIDFVCSTYGLPKPIHSHVGYWAEADPISCFDDDHTVRIDTIREQLPDGIALIGSDYATVRASMSTVTRLDNRIQQGMIAVEQVLATL